MSEPERRMLARTDWAFVHQNPRDGLRMTVSAGGNVGERLMAIGKRGTTGDIRAPGQWIGWAASRSIRGSHRRPAERPFPAACSSAFRSRATW